MPDSKNTRDLLMPQFGNTANARFCSSGAVALARDFPSLDPAQGSADFALQHSTAAQHPSCPIGAPSVFEPKPVLSQLSECKLAASRVSPLEQKCTSAKPRAARSNPIRSEVNS